MMREETPKRGEPTVKRDVKLVPVGNSKGIRLPKVLLQKYGWSDSLVLEELEEGVFSTVRRAPSYPGRRPTAPWSPRGRIGVISTSPLPMA